MKLCQICHSRAATLHLTEIVGNQKKEIHLCEECAHKQGAKLAQDMSFADFIKSVGNPIQKELDKLAKLVCPVCGTSFLEFQQRSLLGCPNDYEVFEWQLMPLLERVQRATAHVGKVPRGIGRKVKMSTEILRLKRHLKRAVDGEQYERAARIRDRLKAMEDQLDAT